MCEEREHWDLKHRAAGRPGVVSPFLVEVVQSLPSGRCLDLAAGRGANSLFMAEQEYQVESVDWSWEAARLLRDEATRRRLDVHVWVADLTTSHLPSSRYDVILCFRCLDRGLWPSMTRALKAGGALVFETYTREHLEKKPDFPAKYCLEPSELLTAFPDLTVALYREIPGQGSAALLALKPESG